jgi:hypothetical protein
VASCGSAPIAIVRQHIENQRHASTRARRAGFAARIRIKLGSSCACNGSFDLRMFLWVKRGSIVGGKFFTNLKMALTNEYQSID